MALSHSSMNLSTTQPSPHGTQLRMSFILRRKSFDLFLDFVQQVADSFYGVHCPVSLRVVCQ